MIAVYTDVDGDCHLVIHNDDMNVDIMTPIMSMMTL